MCLILFSFQPNSKQPLVLAANRDEFFARPTSPAGFWSDAPDVLAGLDLVAGGTWLGITRQGRFAAITNVREPGVMVENPLSRGELTRGFLSSEVSCEAYLNTLKQNHHRYAGFNLLVGDFGQNKESELFYFGNRDQVIRKLEAGIYGLSNHLLNSSWPKVDEGKTQLETLLSGDWQAQDLRDMMAQDHLAQDENLPKTGVSLARERALSAKFIRMGEYGTRAITTLCIGNERVHFSEQNYATRESGIEKDGQLREFSWRF